MKFHQNGGDAFIMLSAVIRDVLDWPFCYVLLMRHYEGHNYRDDVPRHILDLHVVAPEACIDEWDACQRSCGLNNKEWNQLNFHDFCMELASYGLSATVYTNCGNKMAPLLRDLRQKFASIDENLQSYLDDCYNRIGATGWDFLEGNGSLTAHRRKKHEDA